MQKNHAKTFIFSVFCVILRGYRVRGYGDVCDENEDLTEGAPPYQSNP